MDPANPETFNHRTEKLSTGRCYHFVDQIPEAYDPEKTITLLLVHGFPDLWYGWRFQIGPWVKAGYRVVVPDMLGYGGTDKPTEVAEYTTRKLSNDLAALLDLINVQKTVIIGHDWGSVIVGRFASWHPGRLLALVNLSVPFIPPAPTYVSLEQFVEYLPNFGYQLYFADESSTVEVQANIRTLLRLLHRTHTQGPSITLKDTLRPYLIGEKPFEVVNTVSAQELDYYVSQYGDMHGTLCYYRTTKLRFEEEQAGNLPSVLGADLPVLFIVGTSDPTSLNQDVHKFVPNLKTMFLDAGHWIMVERKEDVTRDVLAWLDGLSFNK